MKDEENTRDQLINELVELRQRIAQLKTSESERKQAEEALRESEERYRSLVELAPDGITTMNLKGVIISLNPAALRFSDYSEDELVGKHFSKVAVLRARDIPKYLRMFSSMLTGKVPAPFEIVYRRVDGTSGWGEVHVGFLEVAGRKVGIQAILRDITERKRAEEELRKHREHLEELVEERTAELEQGIEEHKRAGEALRESEERYHDLIESTYDMIQSVAPDGRFIFVNRAWLETLGYTEAELPSLNLWKLIHPESLLHCQEIFSRVVAGESIRNVQATFVAKDGRSILVEGNATGRYIGGKLVATHGFFRDITERKRAEEELQHTLEKLRSALGGIIQAVALTVEARDPYTAGHQRRATNLARAIATEMGLSEEQIDGIRMAGAIHDLGKISVPAGILNKPGRLTENEFAIIQTHPQVGYDILKTIEFPWPVAQIAHQHHERMDGSGYPQGLSGEEILLEARILAVADVVEAMSSHRPYRPALGVDKALEEISQNRGVLYDPEVVDACLKVFTEKGFDFG